MTCKMLLENNLERLLSLKEKKKIENNIKDVTGE